MDVRIMKRLLLWFAGILLFTAFSHLQPAQSAPINPPPPTGDPDVNDVQVVRAYFHERRMVDDLAAWKEPWEVHHEQGYLIIEVDIEEYNWLIARGFLVVVDEDLTAQYHTPAAKTAEQNAGIPGFSCYRTVEETFASAAQIAADNPQLATWTDIGDSWEKDTLGGGAGYDLQVLKLTNAGITTTKPILFIMTGLHARELTPPELNTRFAEYLIDNYGTDADATWLLDYNEIHLLLQSNPDGRKQAETGLFWRKNTDENYCSPTSNNRGADLNRNFPFQWGCCNGSSGSQCNSTYRGTAPESEPETQAITAYVRSIFPDQRADPLNSPAPADASGVFLDIHSYSELVLWPWGFTNNTPPNNTGLVTLGRKFAYFNNYEPEQAVGLYITDGTTVDFAYGELGLAAYTFELGTAFFQQCSTFENTILPDNIPALIYAAKTARAPYLLPAGPDPTTISVTNDIVSQGTLVTLTATLDDTRFNNINGTEPTQNIAAAEYSIDAPFWLTTTTPITVSMTAVDGAFNNGIEDVTATIDTAGLVAGKHTIYVRGMDNAGNFGVVSAIFLTVYDPALTPTTTLANSAGNGLLNWNIVAPYDSFEVYRSNSPYFTPAGSPLAALSAPTNSYTDTTGLGDVNINYFYIIREIIGGSAIYADSNEVGEFDFAVIASSP